MIRPWHGEEKGEVKKMYVSYWDPKCYHGIRGDSDGFRLLIACEVLVAADKGDAPLLILEIHV